MSYTEQDVERVAEALAKRLFSHRALSSPLHRDVLMEKARGHAVAALEAIEREPQPFPSMVGDRDALRELIYDDPILTDDQKREVYRIAEAIRVRVRSNYPELRDIGDRPDAWAYPARILLGMVPRPLEDVVHDLHPGTKICHVWPLLEGGYEAEIGVPVRQDPDGWWDHERSRGEGGGRMTITEIALLMLFALAWTGFIYCWLMWRKALDGWGRALDAWGDAIERNKAYIAMMRQEPDEEGED